MTTTQFNNAVEAYKAYCKRNGYLPSYASYIKSSIGPKFVHLKNVRGVLATYDIATGKITV